MEALFVHHAGSSLARQLALSDYIGGRPWRVNMGEAKISFGNERFDIQVLGSYASNDDTWLWAWANKASGLPANIVKDSETLRDRANELKDDRFSNAMWRMGDFDLHKVAMTCRGVLGADAYYRCPHGGGAVLVVIYGLPAAVTAPVDPLRAVTVLAQLVSGQALPHRLAAENFLEQQGYRIEATSAGISATPAGGTEALVINFDKQGRLGQMQTTLRGKGGPAATSAASASDSPESRSKRARKPSAIALAAAESEKAVAEDSELEGDDEQDEKAGSEVTADSDDEDSGHRRKRSVGTGRGRK